MASMKVNVLSKKVIKPSNPTANDLANLNLSLFDQLAPHFHFHVIFYYLGSEDGDSSRNESARRISQLEKSLSHTLNMFYPLAGRYSQKNICIDCHDQGIEWFEAHVNGKLAEYLKEPNVDFVDKFLPWKSPPAANLDTSPIIGVQINSFDCGGIVLGMTISHTIADANTITRFTTEWAINNRTGIYRLLYENKSYNQFASHFPARASQSLADTDMISEDCELVVKRFFFGEKMISDVREEVAAFLNYKPTRVVVVMALLWKALVAASRAKHSYLRNSMLALTMNMRGKQSFRPPELNYGNFWMLVPVFFIASEVKLELQNLITLIGNTIRDTKEKLANASTNEISSMFIDLRRKIVKTSQETNDWDNYFVSSWSNFPFHKVDFGWGNPSWVSTATTQIYPFTFLVDAKNGDGIEAWVNLKQKDVSQMEKILGF